MMAGYTRNCHVQVFAQIILHKSCFSYIRQRFCNAHTRMESLQFTSLLDLSYLESMYLVSWMLKVPSTFHSPTLLHQLFFFKWYLLKNLNHLFESQFCFPASELSQYGVLLCVCVCLRTSTVKPSSVWNSWECQGTDQQCCVEDVGFLCWFPSSLLWNTQNLIFQLATLSCSYTRSRHIHDLTSIRLAFRTWGLHSPLTGVAFGTQYIVSWSAFASALTRGFPIYLGKVKVTINFSIESSPRWSI